MKILDIPSRPAASLPTPHSPTGVYDNSLLEQYARQLREQYPVNKRILLVQTLQFRLDAINLEVARNKGYYAYPPAGLQHLVQACAGRGIEFKILDLNYELLKRINDDPSFDPLDWLTILDQRIAEFQPFIVGATSICISADILKPYHPLTEVLKHLRAKHPVVVIAGGTSATDEFEGFLNHDYSHFIVRGEGENKINFLLDHLYDEHRAHHSTLGINFKFNGEIQSSQGELDKVTVNGNLIESYKLVPIEDYHNVGSLNPFSRMGGQERPFAGIQLNRGCRADCKFCGVTKFMGAGVRQTSVDDLFAELVYLVEQRGIRHFELLDDDFLGPASLRTGVAELLSRMSSLKEKYGTTWSAGNGLIAGSISEEMMKLIHASGCIGFRIGLESGNQDMLKKMRKPASVKSSILFASKINKYPDMFVSANYIIGLYGEETFGQIMDTFKLSCELGLDWSSYSTFQFTSKTTSKVENLKDDNKGATECIPAKDSAKREIEIAEGIMAGVEVFDIPYDSIPSREQVTEIWFVFNLFSNYINNKNLFPGGRPDKLVLWLRALQVTYPGNPYMTLFAGLCCVLLTDEEGAWQELNKTKKLLGESEYWQKRFAQFWLNDLVEHFPQNPDAVYAGLEAIKTNFPETKNFKVTV